MTVSPKQAAEIEAVAAVSEKIGAVLNFDDLSLSLNALADTAAILINSADDPETARNQFVSALDGALDLLTFMPPIHDGGRCP